MEEKKSKLTLITSYAQTFSGIIVSLLSIPMALHYLNTEEYGLWVVIGQSLGYLMLLDFGVTNAAGRMLAEPVHRNDQEELTSWWTVLVGALASQGLLILLVGLAIAYPVLSFLKVPEALMHDALYLWIGMVCFNALGRPTTALNGIYFVRNRVYMVNLGSIVYAVINLGFFWLFLHMGLRTKAYLYATMLAWCLQTAVLFIGLISRGQLPTFRLSSFRWDKMKSLYGYSLWTFLLAIEIQAVLMSHSLIIAKVLGLAAVTVFSVSTRATQVLLQMLWKSFDAFGPLWLQQYVTGMREVFMRSWKNALVLSFAGALLCGAGSLALNQVFVAIYTKKPDLWAGSWFDLAAVAWMFLHVVLRVLYYPFTVTKNLRGLSFASLAEAPVSVLFAYWGCQWGGLPGMYAGGIVASLLTSGGYSILMACREIGIKESLVRCLMDARVFVSSVVFGVTFALTYFLRTPIWWHVTLGQWLGVAVVSVGFAWFFYGMWRNRATGSEVPAEA